MKVITGIQNAVADCQTHKAVHDKYLKIGWKTRQAAFAESHKDELDSFNKAFRYLKKQGVDLNINLDSLQTEYSNLQATYAEFAGQLTAAKEELRPMKDIRYWVSKVLTPEQSEVEKKPEPKHSVTEKMKFLQEQSNYQPEQKTPQQNMELQGTCRFHCENVRCLFISRKEDAMNVFEAVKQNFTTRQAAEMYGIRVNRHGMAVCPFHNDKNPSMKVDKRFHCFACQADGDAVDFVSRLFGLPSKATAMKLADDFGISYDNRQKHRIKPHIREPTPEQRYRQEESRCYKVLSDYFHHLRTWKQQYAPNQPEDE